MLGFPFIFRGALDVRATKINEDTYLRLDQKMYENVSWVKKHYSKVGFKLKTLESSTLPVLFAERIINPECKTILFYFHFDGQ